MTNDKPQGRPSGASQRPADGSETAPSEDGTLENSASQAVDDHAVSGEIPHDLDSAVVSDSSNAIDPTEFSTSATSPEDSSSAVRWWEAVLRRVGFLPGAKQIAYRQLDRAFARQSEQYFAKYDNADNASTRLPAGEHARMPVVWLAEVFTPVTLPGLLDGIRELAGRSTEMWPRRGDDPVERIMSSRRQGGGAWWPLPVVVPKGSSRSRPDQIEDQLPAGIASVSLSLHSLTRTVTVLAAGFRLHDGRAQGLEDILNKDFVSRAEMLHPRGHTLMRVWNQKKKLSRNGGLPCCSTRRSGSPNVSQGLFTGWRRADSPALSCC